VGTEPYSQVTAQYNARMREFFQFTEIEFIEIERVRQHGKAISASYVRDLLRQRDFDAIRELVPSTTYEYLKEALD
jgi:[citrate (pro-3S)-lyase] ligase